MRLGNFVSFLSTVAFASGLSVSARSSDARDVSTTAAEPRDKLSTECTNPKTRVEWRNMSHDDQVSFVNSIKCLMDAPPKGSWNVTSRYEELVKIHFDHTYLIHNFGYFLSWHRYFVYGFENMLRDECGYEAPFPWWYEVQDAGNFAESGLFEPDLFGTLPEGSAPDNQSFCVDDGVSFRHPESSSELLIECIRPSPIAQLPWGSKSPDACLEARTRKPVH